MQSYEGNEEEIIEGKSHKRRGQKPSREKRE
jgi:hypothetical protein